MDGGYGFIREKVDIKILILFILNQLPAPIEPNMLLELTLCDDAINYFSYTECLTELEHTGHIVILDSGRFLITEKGRSIAEQTGSDLPYTVRMKATANAQRASKILSRESMITAAHQLREDGSCTVQLGLADGLGDIMKLDILAGSEKQAAEMENRFRKDAEALYLKIASVLTETDE